ncbi:hypothetical protein [Nodosilinea sp. P-1105]|uniref:hypothetical protein n=1 Tax=Nodosilinea sp. P-1105 TaxID=2546229 RepID=UPI00146BD025|nr:hypothetical protein [Nodosilinea sp. P-1105]NMF84668.1 hypothetical protein [Nodosilinea sp. P-1105]
MSSLFEQIPEAIRSASGSLYGLLALIVIVTGLLAVWLITQKATNRQERALIYVILFFSAISVAVAIAAGFSSGQVIVDAPPPDESPGPNSISLTPESRELLEQHLQAQGLEVSPQNKASALDEAINLLVNREVDENGNANEPPSVGITRDGNSRQSAYLLDRSDSTEWDNSWYGQGWIGHARPDRYYSLNLENDSILKFEWSENIRMTLQNEGGGGTGTDTTGETSLPKGQYYIVVSRSSTRYEGNYEFQVFANAIDN